MLDSRYDDIKCGNPDARPIRPERDRLNCPSGSLEYAPRVWGYLAENPTTNKNVSWLRVVAPELPAKPSGGSQYRKVTEPVE